MIQAKVPIVSMLTIDNRQRQVLALAFRKATCLVAASGCVTPGIPGKRSQDPRDHDGLLGDFRKGGHAGLLTHAIRLDGHFGEAAL